MLISVAVVISIHYYRNKRTALPPQAMTWQDNELYDSNQSLDEDIHGDKECNVLPEWLEERKEMIFPKDSITKGQQLGKGQFGSVFKGKLVQGNAV
jgi:hypothetical protein